MKKTETAPDVLPAAPDPALTAFRRRQADAAEQLRGRARAEYLVALDQYTAPVSMLDAIAAELTALAAVRHLQPNFADALARYPAPPEHETKRVADLVRGLRGAAAGPLMVLETYPARLEGWQTKIAQIASEDCGSPVALAGSHWLSVWPLLGQARTLQGSLDQLPALEQQLAEVVAEEIARGAAVTVPLGAGPLEAPPTSRTITEFGGFDR